MSIFQRGNPGAEIFCRNRWATDLIWCESRSQENYEGSESTVVFFTVVCFGKGNLFYMRIQQLFWLLKQPTSLRANGTDTWLHSTFLYFSTQNPCTKNWNSSKYKFQIPHTFSVCVINLHLQVGYQEFRLSVEACKDWQRMHRKEKMSFSVMPIGSWWNTNVCAYNSEY
jgi:hypothetical protein